MKMRLLILVVVGLVTAVGPAAAEPGESEARRLVAQTLDRRTTPAMRAKLLNQARTLRKRYPSSHHVAYAHGRLLSALGRSKAALAAYERAIALNAQFADAHYNAGVVLTRLKRETRALGMFLAAGKLNPRLADAHYNAAQILYNRGKFAGALKSWRRVLAIEPGSFGVTKKILQAQHALGRFRAAAKTRARLWQLKRRSKNPRVRRMQSVVIDQFKANRYHVFVYESFSTKGAFAYVYQFKLTRNNRVLASFSVETSSVLRERGWYAIVAVVRNGVRRTTKLSYRKRPRYDVVRRDVTQLIHRLK